MVASIHIVLASTLLLLAVAHVVPAFLVVTLAIVAGLIVEAIERLLGRLVELVLFSFQDGDWVVKAAVGFAKERLGVSPFGKNRCFAFFFELGKVGVIVWIEHDWRLNYYKHE